MLLILELLIATLVRASTRMGCIQSGQKASRKNGDVYHYNGETWLNRPQEGYHWEQNSQRSYERYLNEGTGCEVVAGMAAIGTTGMGVAHVIGDGVGAGCDGDDGGGADGGAGAACGAGGCGGCGAC